MTDQQCCIAGIGLTASGSHEGRSTVSLNVEACRQALGDAGIDKDLVDAVYVKFPTSRLEMMYGISVAEALGVDGPTIAGSWDQGGASNVSMIDQASQAIRSGEIEVALICGADNPRSGTRQ